MLLFHSMFISEDMAVFIFQSSKGPQLPIIWPNEMVKDQVPPRFELGSLDSESKVLTIRPKMGQKGLPGWGKKEKKEEGEKGGKRTLYPLFLYSLIFSTLFTHTSALIARFIIPLILMSLVGFEHVLWQHPNIPERFGHS